MGYSPWGRKEWDTTERLTLSLSILCLEGTGWGCPEHGRMFSSISGLYPLGGGSQPPHSRVVTTPDISRRCRMSSGEQNCYLVPC